MANIKQGLLAMLLVASVFVPALAKDVQVKGYTKKDGTVVKGYTKHVGDKTTTAADTQTVKSYTKKDGTVVKGYTRKKSSKTTSAAAAPATAPAAAPAAK